MLDLDIVLNSWYNSCGHFKCFFKPLAFTTLKQYIVDIQDSIVSPSEVNIGKFKTVRSKLTDSNFVILDLPAEDCIDMCLLLSNFMQFKPVLMFSHVFHKYGLVGSKLLAKKLMSYGCRLSSEKSNKYSLVLDYNRYNNDIELCANMYNNQYEFILEDFPSATMLIECKNTPITIVTGSRVKEDLQQYLDYLNENNILVNVITL